MTIPEDVLQYCNKHNFHVYLQKAIDLVKKFFPRIKSLSLSVEQYYPEDEHIEIELVVSSDFNVLDCYNKFSTEWVRTVAYPQRYMALLSFSIGE